MPAAKHLTLETVDFDNAEQVDLFLEEVMAAGLQRVRSEGDELRAKGLMDADGNLRVDEQPSVARSCMSPASA
jgi:hypothetical protein